MYTVIADTPLGAMRAAAEDGVLRGLWFIGQKYFPPAAETWLPAPDYPVFTSLRAWLKEYFAPGKPETKVPLSPRGTEFQEAVWKILRGIPYGETTSYGAIARLLGNRPNTSAGRKVPAQAVGGAVGHNPISLLIPCHRVLGADGSLTGYAGGLEKKRALLELEGIISRAAPDRSPGR